MLRKMLLLGFLFSFSGLCAQGDSIPIARQNDDYTVFINLLKSKEGVLNIHQSMDVLEAQFSELKKQLSEKNLSPLEEYKAFSSTLSSIQCGHTQIRATYEVLKEWLSSRQAPPFDYFLQGKKLFSDNIYPEDIALYKKENPTRIIAAQIPKHSEIISINGASVSQMIEAISPYISSDENGIDFKYYQSASLFEFYRHIALPLTQDSVECTYVVEGDTLQLYFEPGAAPVHSINARIDKNEALFKLYQNDFGTFKLVADGNGYFRFRSFRTSHGKKYEAFLRSSFQTIRDEQVKNLIIDLRGNTGGAMQYPLMRYFVGDSVLLGTYRIERPKKCSENKYLKKWNSDYFKHRVASRAQKRKIRRKKFNNGVIHTTDVDPSLVFRGAIVVITDEGTFSSASILACHLKTLRNAQIAGRPAGGSFYKGNSGTIVAELPHSGLKLFINPNTFRSQLPESSTPQEIKEPNLLIEPGYILPQRIESYYYERALQLLKQVP